MYEFDFYQSMLTFIILIFSFMIIFAIGCKERKDVRLVVSIFLWHTFFSFAYYAFTLFNVADAEKYFVLSLNSDFKVYPGSPFIVAISAIFTKLIDASYLNVTLVFNIFGTLGLVYFYLTLKKLLKEISNYWMIVFFIPSMSFWSAGLGKDAISFFSTCLFLYAITTSKKTKLLIPIAFFFMFMVRPHIAFIMLVSYVVYFIIQARVHLLFKFLILPIIAVGLIVSIGFVQEYVGLDDASLDSVSGYIDERQGSNQGGGSSLDIASMSYPVQMFTYIFRPLPFDANSALALFTSVENSIFLIIFVYVVYKSKFSFFIQDTNLWLFMYVLLSCTILAMTTANLGIATRQKWMIMPVLIYLLVFAFYKYKINNVRITK